jgi:hypothetical protein
MSNVGQPLNFDEADPAAPAGAVNVVFQADAPTPPPTSVVRNISAYMPVMTNTAGGAVPTPPNDSTKCLDGTGNWSSKGGGGGGSNDDISYYLSPSTISPPSLTTWLYHVNATKGFNANGALVMTTYSSVNPEILGESIAAEDFDIIGCFAANPPVTGSKLVTYGINLVDTVSGKVVSFQVNMATASNPVIQIDHYPSFTGTPTEPYTVANPAWAVGPVWLRINSSYGKYTFYVSVDGQSWDRCYQESTTAYLTNPANEAGIGFYNNSSTAQNLVVPHFVVDSYVGS